MSDKKIDLDNYLVFETECFSINQFENCQIPGYLIVMSKLEIHQLADFTETQSIELMNVLRKAEKLIKNLIQPERIYILKFAEVNPCIHFHLVPRTIQLGKIYEAEMGDSIPFNGAKLVEWLWKNHEKVAFSDREVSDFIARARAVSAESYKKNLR